jgi:hypothetical protein
MKAIGNIFLIWRPGRGNRRFPVGVIKRNVIEGISFRYDTKIVSQAKEYGFVHYEGFPEISKVYHENVIEIFGQRIIKSERNDTKDFYDFWGVDSRFINDKYYMLAYTQGLLPTDNYEFLADFNPIKGLTFITEITGLSHNQIPCDIIQVGDELDYVLDKKNSFDKDAVTVFKNKVELGYIKAIHCKVFGKSKNLLSVTVVRIEKNEFLNRVFLKVEAK